MSGRRMRASHLQMTQVRGDLGRLSSLCIHAHETGVNSSPASTEEGHECICELAWPWRDSLVLCMSSQTHGDQASQPEIFYVDVDWSGQAFDAPAMTVGLWYIFLE